MLCHLNGRAHVVHFLIEAGVRRMPLIALLLQVLSQPALFQIELESLSCGGAVDLVLKFIQKLHLERRDLEAKLLGIFADPLDLARDVLLACVELAIRRRRVRLECRSYLPLSGAHAHTQIRTHARTH
eukprot:4094738-Pleurochrysis_carterae.AAC.1